MNNYTPSILCRLFGHKWRVKDVDELKYAGYRFTRTYAVRYCIRCGCENPYYQSKNQ